MCAFLGKPFQINSAVFFDNVQKGRGVGESNPCLKIMLQIFYHSKGGVGGYLRKYFLTSVILNIVRVDIKYYIYFFRFV